MPSSDVPDITSSEGAHFSHRYLIQENLMKPLFIAPLLLIDCGRVSKRTRGTMFGFFTEGGTAPTNRYT